MKTPPFIVFCKILNQIISPFKFIRRYEQGADINRIRDYVRKWLQLINGFGTTKNVLHILLYVPVHLRSLTPELQS